jgi:SOS response regulatory protein OraA/RecX
MRAGLLDDARYADARARVVAARGVGDQLVLDDLARHGVDEALAREAVARLEPEAARAAAVIEAHGRSARTLRRLVSRGFSEESLEQLIAELENGALR